ncbi:MAG: hypothetical protein AABX04_08390, partial [Nanoarchaeota archaeon]
MYSNDSERIFEFEVRNELLNQTIPGVSWNCTESIVSLYQLNLTGNQSLYDYMYLDFTSPGEKNFTCVVTSNDGRDTASLKVIIPGIEIENYDVLAENTTNKIVTFNARNEYLSTNTSIGVVTEG